MAVFNPGEIVRIREAFKDCSVNGTGVFRVLRVQQDVLFLTTVDDYVAITIEDSKGNSQAIGLPQHYFEHISPIEIAKYRIKNEL